MREGRGSSFFFLMSLKKSLFQSQGISYKWFLRPHLAFWAVRSAPSAYLCMVLPQNCSLLPLLTQSVLSVTAWLAKDDKCHPVAMSTLPWALTSLSLCHKFSAVGLFFISCGIWVCEAQIMSNPEGLSCFWKETEKQGEGKVREQKSLFL